MFFRPSPLKLVRGIFHSVQSSYPTANPQYLVPIYRFRRAESFVFIVQIRHSTIESRNIRTVGFEPSTTPSTAPTLQSTNRNRQSTQHGRHSGSCRLRLRPLLHSLHLPHRYHPRHARWLFPQSRQSSLPLRIRVVRTSPDRSRRAQSPTPCLQRRTTRAPELR